ncbi:ribosome recycling factor domain-containing protein [Plectosphaerella plurivora]|uniref:Ribosome recycling factor domain-containing protein n=1 Tax=Plectosphaerella plurivora TaxID=936078 RepID=A0A9P9ADI7_9PEZI|nr:ribosome recycling factor domain-containing protein [Plectosphaerella plurivora]
MKSLRVNRLVLQRINGLVSTAGRSSTASQLAAPVLVAALRPLRPFSTSQLLLKKSKGKKAAEQEATNPGSVSRSGGGAAATSTAPEEDDDHKHPKPDPADPLNIADLTSRWTASDAHFRAALKMLSTGGRFNPDHIGALLVAPDPKSPERYPLRELAQVVPRSGRTISLLAHERAHVKPIIDAVQASPDFNQQPQADPDNELDLVLRVEPDRKEDLVARAKALVQAWREQVRKQSEKRKKVVAKWAAQKEIGPDVKRKIEQDVQKAQNKVMEGIDQVEKQTLQKF